MDVLVAGAADDEGLAVACCHPCDPFGLVRPSPGVEVFEGTDMVGSGAGVPLQGSSVTRPQNRACTFRRTRLSRDAI